MMSQTVEYALRAMVCLANASPEPQTTEALAQVTRVPPAYLSKVMLGLTRAGLVRSQRGPNGGFTLVRSPDDISLLQVVNAVDPIRRIHTCPLDIPQHGGRLCPLHRRLDQVLAMTESAFSETSLADVVGEKGGVTPLCDKTRRKLVSLK
ncbi:MAG TPA: Rrf2 family transcriptional regulator [Planctomycetaceae bacterium]|nr:Rrf2 family transcriptional regulator [Planctomycetaceae bacterium]